MTVLQLRVVIAVAETKSISAAAKMLKISQPNASNCLKLLEEELGLPVFLRSSSGAELTPKGAQLLPYARQMVDASEKLIGIRDGKQTYRLHLGTVNYYAAAEPFFALCADHRNDDTKLDLRYASVSVTEGIRELVKRELDVVVAPVMKHQMIELQKQCKAEPIELIPICSVPSIMMIQKKHPLVMDERCRNITMGCDTMKDYLYVALRNIAGDADAMGYSDSNFIQSSYTIYVDDTNARLRVIESTNGFGFGILSSYRMMKQFNLVSFPVPGVVLDLFCMVRSGEGEYREINEYVTRLKKEMAGMLERAAGDELAQ